MAKARKKHGRRTGPAPAGRRRGPRPPASSGEKGRWVVGAHAVREALKVRPQAVAELWLREGLPVAEMEEWEALTSASSTKLQRRSPRALDALASGHQGVAARVTESPEVDLEELLGRKKACVVALDQTEDPHNLGSVLRTGWLFGISALAVARDRAVGLTPAACKVASGGAEHVPLLQLGAWSTDLEAFKKAGFWVFGLDEAGSQSLYQLDLPDKILWVLGAEGRGLRKSTKAACDELIVIPQVSSGSSYNVSVAAALCLGESHRQKGFW